MLNNFARNEFKYFIPLTKYRILLDDISKFTVLDNYSNNSQGYYNVHSIYFENLNNQIYFDKINGIGKRAKFRIRYYKKADEINYIVELKFKLLNKYIKKRKIIKGKMIDDLLSSFPINAVELKNYDLEGFLYYAKSYNFFPYLCIDYERIAFYDKLDKKVRLTIDQNITASRISAGESQSLEIPTFPRGVSILELKTSEALPYWLSFIIKKYNLKNEAISKYTYSVQRVTYNSGFLVR